MTHDADPSSRRSAPASFGMPGRAVGTSHYTLAANFFESARSVRGVASTESAIGDTKGPRSSIQHALQAPVSYSMAVGTVMATFGAIALAVATFGT